MLPKSLGCASGAVPAALSTAWARVGRRAHACRNSALSEGGPGVSVNGHASDGPSQPALGHPPSNRYARSSSVVVRRSHVAKQYSRQASRGLGRLSGRPKFVSFAPEVEQELIDNEERAEPVRFLMCSLRHAAADPACCSNSRHLGVTHAVELACTHGGHEGQVLTLTGWCCIICTARYVHRTDKQWCRTSHHSTAGIHHIEHLAWQAAFENSLESRESRDEFKRQRSREMSLKLHQLEKHFRKNKLRVSVVHVTCLCCHNKSQKYL